MGRRELESEKGKEVGHPPPSQIPPQGSNSPPPFLPLWASVLSRLKLGMWSVQKNVSSGAFNTDHCHMRHPSLSAAHRCCNSTALCSVASECAHDLGVPVVKRQFHWSYSVIMYLTCLEPIVCGNDVVASCDFGGREGGLQPSKAHLVVTSIFVQPEHMPKHFTSSVGKEEGQQPSRSEPASEQLRCCQAVLLSIS